MEIDENGHTDRDLIFEKKLQKALEKNLVVNLLDLDYDVGNRSIY